MTRVIECKEIKVRVRMKASGHARWFERPLAELNFELWIGRGQDPNQARTQAEYGSPGCAAGSEVNAERLKTFRRSGCRAGRIGICGNCCGTATVWCRRVPGS